MATHESAADVSSRMMMSKAHGFVYPANMPPCSQCDQDANTGAHVNPPRTAGMMTGERRMVSADRSALGVRRSHVYSNGYAGFIKDMPCQSCGQSMGASMHPPGMPVGAGTRETSQDRAEATSQIVLVRHPLQALAETQMCALCGYDGDDEVHGEQEPGAETSLVSVKQFTGVTTTVTAQELPTQKAFVAQLGGKTILAAPARVLTDPSGLPRELAGAWEKASAANPHFLWIDGRYVEAEAANRNNAYWSTEDLQLGEPTIAHGPLNWLHEERHIIGTIAAAQLVHPEREAAAAGERAHIRSLAAVWRYLWPTEARQVAQHSDAGTLWYSMECISREVSCLADGCTHTQSYSDYMNQPITRCHHIKAGAPRRFADPSFLGGAVIIPPIRPGWAGAHASVMRQAAMLIEEQQGSVAGLADSEAVSVIAQVIRYATGGTP